MSLDYMKNVQQIKQFLVDGKADTCEEAVDMFEESMLFTANDGYYDKERNYRACQGR